MTSIEVCIPSRDGRIDGDVLTRAHAACAFAARSGTACELTRVIDRYTVASCRNRGVAGFLRRDKSHLLFVDEDVLVPGGTLAILAGAASRHPDAVVCGCVPSVRIDDRGDVAPYVQVKPMGGDWLRHWPADDVAAECCGGGCMMIPRAAFDKLDFPWFRWPETYNPGGGIRAITDDGDFCSRVLALGIGIFGIAAVRCGHKKEIDVATLIKGA